MIDYISASTFLKGKDKPNFANCEADAYYSSGWIRHYINGCKKLEVDWNEGMGMIRLRGSIMYFWQGHNLTYLKKDFVDAINYINGIVNVNWWNACVDAFEYGIIIPVDKKPKEYILHHSSIPSAKLTMNEKPKDKGKFRWWEDSGHSLKMYDAKTNFNSKAEIDRKELLEDMGASDSQLLKWEVHYKKPNILNKGKELMLADLVNPCWDITFRTDLYEQYNRLTPMKNYVTPNNKKDLSTSDIIAIVLLEDNLNEGRTAEEVKKMLYSRVNSIPEDILTKSDKDARKRQIKGLLDKVQVAEESQWDLSDNIAEALEVLPE